MVEFAHDKRIFKIADRAVAEMTAQSFAKIWEADRLSLIMDLAAVHQHTPLRLDDLLSADSFNFLHDIMGIGVNINRETGRLENFFCPRFAAPVIGR